LGLNGINLFWPKGLRKIIGKLEEPVKGKPGFLIPWKGRKNLDPN